jgi:hypothetical protein
MRIISWVVEMSLRFVFDCMVSSLRVPVDGSYRKLGVLVVLGTEALKVRQSIRTRQLVIAVIGYKNTRA